MKEQTERKKDENREEIEAYRDILIDEGEVRGRQMNGSSLVSYRSIYTNKFSHIYKYIDR